MVIQAKDLPQEGCEYFSRTTHCLYIQLKGDPYNTCNFIAKHLLQTETHEGPTPTMQFPEEDVFDEDDWEDQADKLYEWTQNLSLDELGVTSP